MASYWAGLTKDEAVTEAGHPISAPTAQAAAEEYAAYCFYNRDKWDTKVEWSVSVKCKSGEVYSFAVEVESRPHFNLTPTSN